MDGNLSVNYVRLAIVPNFNQSGTVFLVGATSTEALEAAGSFLLSSDAEASLLRHFHVKKASDLPALELVLEVKGFDSVPDDQRVVAERTIQNY